MFQYDKHTVHCVLVSVSSISHNSMFPTSRIICFDSGLKGLVDSVVDLVEEHVDLDGSQFSESIVERWYFARISQRNVVVLEFGSPCRPRSPSLVHDSCHDQQWIFPFFTKYFIRNVERIKFMTYLRVVLCCSCVSNKSSCSFISLLNIETHLVFRNNRSSRSV